MTTPPTPPPPPPGEIPPSGGASNSDDKTMALIAHFGIIVTGFIAPLIIYLVKNENPWVKREAAKAFNFTIGISVLFIGLSIVNFALGMMDSTGIISLASSCITCLIYPVALIANLVFAVMNGMKVNNGEETKYPFEIPILK